MKSKYNKLFEPFKLPNGITIKNRLVMAPMTTWASNEDGTISDDELKYYSSRVHGVGLIITGCTPVTENGIGFANEFLAYDDKFIPSLKKLADTLKSGGAPAILQIFHAGNKAVTSLIPNGELVSASAVETPASIFAEASTPRELTHEEILDIINAFGETTRRAIEAGFDGVELHGAHGFLLQNFESPLFNQRTDEWGGSLENRLRFPITVVQEVKKVIKEYAKKPFILGYRISPDEPNEGGLRYKDTESLIDQLVEQGIDYIHASLVNALNAKPVDDQDGKSLIELVTNRINDRVPLIVAGFLRTPDDLTKAIEYGPSMVALGQALIMNPTFVEMLANGEEDQLATVLNVSKQEDLSIPDSLLNVIKSAPGWFNIKE